MTLEADGLGERASLVGEVLDLALFFSIAALCLRKLLMDILAGELMSSVSSTTSNLLFDERVLAVVLSVVRVVVVAGNGCSISVFNLLLVNRIS